MARAPKEHDVRNWTLPDHFSTDPVAARTVAARTRWTPCRPHQGNLKSDERTLVVVDDQRLVWKGRPEPLHVKLITFHLAILLAGIILMASPWFPRGPHQGMAFILFPLGAFFAVWGSLVVWHVYSSRCDRIFDRERDHRKGPGGGYSIGTPLHPFSTAQRNSAEAQKAITGRPRSGNLNDIYAVQVIGKLVNLRSYELNIVLRSGIRVNIIDHNDAAVIREEASTLATFLTVPVWDDSDRGVWKFLLSEKLSPKTFFKVFWLWYIKRDAPGAWYFLPGQWKGRWGITTNDEKWELGYAYLLDYVEVKGHARIHESYQSDDYFFGPFPLGEWVARQRAEIETLSTDQRKRLEMLPGWTTSDLANQ